MSPSEITFLAVGLVIGAALSAAIVEALRARPARRHQVRVTISPNAVRARRSTTLADPSARAERDPIPGSPDDRARADRPMAPFAAPANVAPGTPAATSPERTRVPSGPVTVPVSAVAVAIDGASVAPVGPGRLPGTTPSPALQADATEGTPPRSAGVAVLEAAAIPTEDDGVPPGSATAAGTAAAPAAAPAPIDLPSALDVGGPTVGLAVKPRAPVPVPRPSLGRGAVAVAVVGGGPRPTGTADGLDPGPGGTPAVSGAAAVDPCGAARHLVDERCALATAAREHARIAGDALREGQRAYDALRAQVDEAQAVADPRALAAAKDELHRRFRQASDAAAGADEAEAAAREWLSAVNDLNVRARDALRVLDTGGAELKAAIPRLERLTLEADAARISADGAAAGCQEAREGLAACEEQAALVARAASRVEEPAEPHPFDALWPGEAESTRSQPANALSPAPPSDEPLILRMLRGDRVARDRLVATLARDDADGVRTWQLRLVALMDAITARAIEDGYLDLPDDHPFWGMFDPRERREIVGALSALGYRFDGLGAFADERVPAARDLSLAVGYAGLDRMRIRAWPQDAELAALYEGAVVAADEWLAAQADDLSLGRMVDALGARAGDLADVWNVWGRLRPALLSST